MLTSAETAEIQIGDAWYRLDIIEPPDITTASWAHPGVCVDRTGELLWTAPDGRTIRRLERDGRVAESRRIEALEGHGLAADDEGGLWIADPGRKATAEGADVSRRIEPGRVTRVDAAGARTQEIPDPNGGGWRPSGVALFRFGSRGDGRVWVADGYGDSMVHCFTAGGEVAWSSDGSDSGIPFDTPHGIVIDDRGSVPRLLVADRGNARVVALTLDGEFVGTVGDGAFTSPSNFAIDGRLLWVTELFGAIRVLDEHDALVGSLGDGRKSTEHAWPNRLVDGQLTTPSVTHDRLRAPHGIAATDRGEIFVSEWMIGGRVVRLTPHTP